VRDNGLPAARTTAITTALKGAEQMSGAKRSAALKTLAGQLDQDVASARDAKRVRALATVVKELEAK
jgi:hypothetical protein